MFSRLDKFIATARELAIAKAIIQVSWQHFALLGAASTVTAGT
jgi:hypothetical protein